MEENSRLPMKTGNLYGHVSDGRFKYDDIFQRAGSIYRILTESEKARLGWDESFEQEFARRKVALIKQQEKHFDISQKQ